MIRNYFTSAIRNIRKRNLNFLINVSGLTLGLFCVLIILLYVQNELKYDEFHEGSERIYRVEWHTDQPQTRTPHPMAQALVKDFPEVEAAVSLSPLWGPGLTKRKFQIWNKEKDEKYLETGILSVDSNFFDVFSFPLIIGNKQTVLRSPNTVLLSKSTALKYFGTANCLGSILTIESAGNDFEVAGVFEDVPDASHFHFDILVGYVHLKPKDQSPYYTWNDFGHFNYIKLKPGTDSEALESKVLPWMGNYIQVTAQQLEMIEKSGYSIQLTPIERIHLQSNIRWELENNGNIEYVYILSGAGVFILILAMLNFINLSVASAKKRFKEIGVRKTLGAQKNQLVVQFIGESVFTAFLSLILAGLLMEITIPLLQVQFGLSIEEAGMYTPFNIGLYFVFGITTGILSGIYPALFMSATNPILALKGKIIKKSARRNNLLLITQFCISMVMICGSLLIYNQLNYLNNKPLGFEKQHTLLYELNSAVLKEKYSEIKKQIQNIAGIQDVSASSNLPGSGFNQNEVYSNGEPQNEISFSEMFVDHEFIQTMGIELALGRAFEKRFNGDSLASFILNESGATALQLKDPIGAQITWKTESSDVTGTVIGIVKDFHYQSLHTGIRPLILVHYPAFNHVVLRLDTENSKSKIAQINAVFQQFDPDYAPQPTFLSDNIQNQYENESSLSTLFTGFSILAILIACIGLFGMATLSFAERTKEISIKKILGARLAGLMGQMLWEYSKQILIAITIAIPIVYYWFDKWLASFAFKASIDWIVFVGTGLLLLTIAWCTIGYLSYKTASSNPIHSLKEE